MSNEFIPRNAAKFGEYVYNILHYVEQHIADWERIPREEFTVLQDTYIAFQDAMREAEATPTRANIYARNDAQKICERTLRQFIKMYLRFAPVTNQDLLAMGIPPIDNVRTAHVVVDEMVSFEIRRRRENELMIHFQQ